MIYRPETKYNFTCRHILEFLRSELAMDGFVLYHKEMDTGFVEFISGNFPGVKEGMDNESLSTISNAVAGGHFAPIVSDVTQTAYQELQVFQNFNPTSIVALPITSSNALTSTLLCGISTSKPDNDLINRQALLEFCAHQVANAISDLSSNLNTINEIESLTEQAFRDSMTGLLNRNGWEAAVEATMRNGFGDNRSVSVFVVDVDGLKQLNDTQGHAAGDEAIRKVAIVLQQFFAPQGIAPFADDEPFVARTGGDEFIGLQFGCDDEEAQMLIASINKALSTTGIAVSIGAACCRSIRKLPKAILNADEVMYEQKKKAKFKHPTQLYTIKAAS